MAHKVPALSGAQLNQRVAFRVNDESVDDIEQQLLT